MAANKHNQTCIKKAMLLLNSVLTILLLEKVSAEKFSAEKLIIKVVDSPDSNADKDIIVKISPDAIFKSFRAVVSSDYLRNLADEFAQKAAAHFMTIIKGTEEKKFRQDKFDSKTDLRPPNNTEDNLIIPPATKKKEKPLVNKEEVLVLLRDPAIDGDNLEEGLSDENPETTEGNTVRLKINGAYYKRHNLAATPDLSNTEEHTTKLISAKVNRRHNRKNKIDNPNIY